MLFIRIVAIALPQFLLLMLIGAVLGLLGNWNHTDAGFGTLILLFLLNPVVAVIYLLAELLHYRKLGKQGNATRSFLMPGFAIFIFFEVLATNLYLLSQVRM
jgi:hypothetical protein